MARSTASYPATRERTPQPGQPTLPRRLHPAAGQAARVAFTWAGAILLVVGGLSTWTRGLTGVSLDARAFEQSLFVHGPDFVKTAGFAMILLGFIVLVGSIPRLRWLAAAGGAAAVAGFMLFVIQLYRAPVPELPGPGALLCGLGGALALGGVLLVSKRATWRR